MNLYRDFTQLSDALDFIVDLNVRGFKGRLVKDYKTRSFLVLYTTPGERGADNV